MPLVSLDAVTIAFGHLPLLDRISLRVEPRERVAVIGRNGTGKSTLLKIISGAVQVQPGEDDVHRVLADPRLVGGRMVRVSLGHRVEDRA